MRTSLAGRRGRGRRAWRSAVPLVLPLLAPRRIGAGIVLVAAALVTQRGGPRRHAGAVRVLGCGVAAARWLQPGGLVAAIRLTIRGLLSADADRSSQQTYPRNPRRRELAGTTVSSALQQPLRGSPPGEFVAHGNSETQISFSLVAAPLL